MKNILVLLPLSCLLGVALCACGGAGQKAAQKPLPATGGGPEQKAPESSRPAAAEGLTPDEQFVFHLAEVVNIIKENWGNCKQAGAQGLAYIEQHQESIDEGVNYGKRKEQELTGDAADAYDKKMESLLFELIPDFEEILGGFGQNCPNEKERIGKALGVM